MKPLKAIANQPNACITAKDISIIFSDIEVISNVADAFYEKLKERSHTFQMSSFIVVERSTRELRQNIMTDLTALKMMVITSKEKILQSA